MLEAIQRIEKYAQRGRRDFDADELVQTFIVHHLQILGEAATKLPAEFRDRYPAIPWSKILGMRHVLVHDYFRVDLAIVWAVVEHELSPLRTQLESILSE